MVHVVQGWQSYAVGDASARAAKGSSNLMVHFFDDASTGVSLVQKIASLQRANPLLPTGQIKPLLLLIGDRYEYACDMYGAAGNGSCGVFVLACRHHTDMDDELHRLNIPFESLMVYRSVSMEDEYQKDPAVLNALTKCDAVVFFSPSGCLCMHGIIQHHSTASATRSDATDSPLCSGSDPIRTDVLCSVHSSSSLDGKMDVRAVWQRIRKVAIGPTTADALRELGADWQPAAVCASPTPAGVLDALTVALKHPPI